MNISKQTVTDLLQIGAVKLRIEPPFAWNTGLHTPIYCDNRLIISFPEERKRIVEAFKHIITEQELEFDVLGGTATAAVPWASFLAHELNMPMVYIKHKSKGYGTNKTVEGTAEKGSRILIVEDLISTGGSAIRAVESCTQELDAQVIAVLAIFTYEFEKAKKSFADANVPLHTLSNFTTLVNVSADKGMLKPEEKEMVLNWNKDPNTWSEQHGGVRVD